MYCMTDWRTYPLLYPIFIRYFDMRNLIVWDYEWLKTGNYYRYSYELIMFGVKGASRRNFSNKETDIWRNRCVNYTKERLHPAEKPIELMERMIKNSTGEGDTVLDCFAGSGTTGVACVNTNRRFIGFELDKDYYEIAVERLEAARSAKAQALF